MSSSPENLPTSPVWGCQPLFSSLKLGGKNVNLNYYRHPPYKLTAYRSSQLLLIVFLSDGEIERALEKKRQNESVRKGYVSVVPDNIYHRASWKQELEFLLIEIEPKSIAEIDKIAVGEPVKISPCFACSDALLYGIALALLHECQHCNSYSIYTELLWRTMITHLLRRYSNTVVTTSNNQSVNLRTKYKLEQAVKYINSYLNYSLNLEEIAEEIGISKHYFCHSFKKYFGMTPYQYILQQRVEKAKLLMRQDSERPLADIALESGFSSQSHLNKHFRSFTGTSPHQYKLSIYSLL